jgi:hypothetical protein
MRSIVKDMNNVMDNKVQDKELTSLVESLDAYSKSRQIGSRGSQKHVDLLLLISAILDIPEEGFEELLNRLNIIRLRNLGLLPGNQGVKH